MDSKEELTRAAQFIQEYEADILKLYRYVPWLMDKSGSDVAHDYDGEQGKSDLRFPVYDGTLMNFVKEAQKTVFMDKNYAYAYSRRRIFTPKEEEAFLAKASSKDIDFLKAVISKYVSEGMRKAGKWQDAVERKLFLNVLLKLKEILDYYKKF